MMHELIPGVMNDYGIGYQDCTGYSATRPKLDEPAQPHNEHYMTGWFAGLQQMAESPTSKTSLQYSNPKKWSELYSLWNKWRIEHGLPRAERLPL